MELAVSGVHPTVTTHRRAGSHSSATSMTAGTEMAAAGGVGDDDDGHEAASSGDAAAVGEERQGANLRDRFRQRLAGFVPVQWLIHTQRELERLQPPGHPPHPLLPRHVGDLEAGTIAYHQVESEGGRRDSREIERERQRDRERERRSTDSGHDLNITQVA